MNIASAVVAQPPSATASSGPARSAAVDDLGGADAVADTDASLAATFGRMLALRLDGRGMADDVRPSDPAADGAVVPDDRSVARPDARAPTLKDDVSDAVVPGRDASPDDDAKDGSDLAAQLALVSQWAALPPALDKAPATPSADRRVDLRDKLDAVRGMVAPRKDGDDPASRRNEVDVAPRDQAGEPRPTVALPFAAASDRLRTPGVAAPSRSVSSRTVDLDAKTDAKAADASERQPAVDAFLTRVEAVTPTATTDATSLASAVVAAVSHPVADPRPALAVISSPTTTLHEPVGSPAWAHEVGQATLRMAADNLQSASLRLSPEHLGPVDVQVRIDHGVAHLAFDAAHPETRQALEASRTTLDQLFADQGLKVGDCAVGDSSRRRFDDGTARQWTSSGADVGAGPGSDLATTTTTTTTVRLKSALGLVDTFA